MARCENTPLTTGDREDWPIDAGLIHGELLVREQARASEIPLKNLVNGATVEALEVATIVFEGE